jgi:hypothetical protein
MDESEKKTQNDETGRSGVMGRPVNEFFAGPGKRTKGRATHYQEFDKGAAIDASAPMSKIRRDSNFLPGATYHPFENPQNADQAVSGSSGRDASDQPQKVNDDVIKKPF